MATDNNALTTLPPEMQSAIAEQGDPHDLLALRLTCKKLEVACYDSFIRTFFSKRAHLYSCYGLQSLVEITERPHLARKMQEIELVCAKLGVHPKHSTHPMGLRMSAETERREVCERDHDLIRQILENLKSVGATPAITVSCCPSEYDIDYQETVATYHGLTDMRRLLQVHVDEGLWIGADGNLAVDAVLGSIARTCYPVQRLNLCKGASWNGFQPLWYRGRGDILSALGTSMRPFSSLTNRTLVITMWRSSKDFFLYLEIFCGYLTALHTLSLSSPCGERCVARAYLARLPAALKTSSLRSIELHCFGAPALSYIDMLNTWKHSVTRLSLLEIGSVYHWSTLLKWCAENLKLDHLQVEGLYRSDIVSHGFSYRDKSSDGKGLQLTLQDSEPVDCNLNGVSKIQDFLRTVADVPQYLERDGSAIWKEDDSEEGESEEDESEEDELEQDESEQDE